ncbi:MAG: cation:proton antiporter [Bacteroidaceae bacterium]|nr:cation:proton antiporter [Bacteroidaceae bacterium]
MSALAPLIDDLALILICAGAMTLIFKKLKQPLVLGYIVAGFLASPNMPWMPSVKDLANVHLWSEIGVIFLLFALGLEFSFKKIMKMGASPIIAACVIIFSMMSVGFLTGRAFGWQQMDCIFLGGMLAMSSTTIIYKAFDDMGLRQQKFAGLVLGVLIIEDILAIVLMVMLSTLALSQHFEGLQMVASIAKLGFFLVLWFVVGIYLIPLFLRKTKTLMSDETMLIVSLALCFGMVVIASSVGFSPAFGAFIMGSILAETIEAETIEHLVNPVKDLFGAIFFVSVGMMVDISLIVEYAFPIICIILAIMLGQTILSTIGFLLSGQPLKTAMQCSFSLTQIGEFAFILATLGTSLGVTSDFLYPIVVAVSVFTTFTTPYMIRLALPAYNALHRLLPEKWKATLDRYASDAPEMAGQESPWRTFLSDVLRTVLIYGVLCIAVVVISINVLSPIIYKILPGMWGQIAFAIITIICLAPFLRALMVKKMYSSDFQTLWSDNNFNRAPLLSLIVLRMIIGGWFIGFVLDYSFHWTGLLLIVPAISIIFLMIASRRLKRQSLNLERTFTANLNQRENRASDLRPQYAGKLMERNIHISVFTVPIGISWAGKTLSQAGLGHKYGVHVVALQRGAQRINIPNGNTLLLPGDRMQVIGSDEQLQTFSNVIEAAAQEARQSVTELTEEMTLRRYTVDAQSDFIGRTLRDCGIRERYNCLIVGIEDKRSKELLSPTPSHVFEIDDVIWVVGTPEDIKCLPSSVPF